ncbi:hypothetical protein ACFWY5_23625 [Nonomuraea sp. NPDC059007]|uniref:hypothetical protein n=1 Tax=Nonomuraea sp. NPDC059007 TaxID=3346692 RepID=UPI0036BBB213
MRVKFTVAPGQDARMVALERLGQISRQLADHVQVDGPELCDQDSEIAYVGPSGRPTSREKACGGTAWLKTRTRRQRVKRGVLPVPVSSDPGDLLKELAAALTDAVFGDIVAAVDVAKE